MGGEGRAGSVLEKAEPLAALAAMCPSRVVNGAKKGITCLGERPSYGGS